MIGLKRVLALCLLGYCVLPEAVLADACNCPASKADVKTELSNATLVFVGQVEKVGRNPMKPGESEVRFTTLRKFKGFEELPTGENLVTLYTPDDQDCGFKFFAGLDYLIYARGTPAHFVVDTCTRTELLDNVISEVQQVSTITRVGFLPTTTTSTTKTTTTTRRSTRRFELR